jgi:hypothetical protein
MPWSKISSRGFATLWMERRPERGYKQIAMEIGFTSGDTPGEHPFPATVPLPRLPDCARNSQKRTAMRNS